MDKGQVAKGGGRGYIYGAEMQDSLERLWAPWRIGYVLSKKDTGCFLCELQASENDKEAYILQRGKSCFTLLNLYPYNNGHLLLAPYRHIADVAELTSVEWDEMGRQLKVWVRRIQEKMRPHAFNIGFNLGRVAGAGVVGHLHLHVVPRWDGDHNFMSIISDTRVIIQSLDEAYEVLCSDFEGDDGSDDVR